MYDIKPKQVTKALENWEFIKYIHQGKRRHEVQWIKHSDFRKA